MDFIREAAAKASDIAKQSAKHAVEIASMANTAAKTFGDHQSADAAVRVATGAVDQMHAADAMNTAVKNALKNGDREYAVNASIEAMNASKNAAELSHDAALHAESAGAPSKIVDLVTSHAMEAGGMLAKLGGRFM
jgi:hypothetical protein